MARDLPKLPNWKQIFHYGKRKLKSKSKLKREVKQHGDTKYTAIYYRFRDVTVDLMLQSQGFYHKDCHSNIVNERTLEFNQFKCNQLTLKNFDSENWSKVRLNRRYGHSVS